MIEPLTPSQVFRELTLRGLKATLHHAMTLRECYERFWTAPDVLEMLNADISLTLARFQENTALGHALNEALEHAGEDLRVPVQMPAGYSFDGSAFVYTPPVMEPEP